MILWGLLAIGIVVCFMAGLVLARQAAQHEAEVGLPLSQATVVYSDTGAWEELPRSLISDTFGLIGKPDYILRTAEGVIPVEVKPLRLARQPYTSDVMQLAAYCLLVEETTGTPPPYALLRYARRTFRIEWNDDLYNELLETLAEMRDLHEWPVVLNGEMPPPQHDMTVRCDACGFHYVCWPDR